jgi:hypothetical protein
MTTPHYDALLIKRVGRGEVQETTNDSLIALPIAINKTDRRNVRIVPPVCPFRICHQILKLLETVTRSTAFCCW